jgi:hypothetical protein
MSSLCDKPVLSGFEGIGGKHNAKLTETLVKVGKFSETPNEV